MKNFETIITTLVGLLLIMIIVLLISGFITALPWYTWNHIISPKFNTPLFSFWEMFFTIITIKFILMNVHLKRDSK